MIMKPYFELSGLEHIYLEDSWVVGINADKNNARFKVEFVLTEHHEEYHLPHEGKQYCYKVGVLKFENCSEINWHSVHHVGHVDLDGQIEMGNIHNFNYEGDTYHLQGDWGEVEITCEKVSLDFCSGETEKGSESV